MHLIRFSPHGTNSKVRVQGLYLLQVFRVKSAIAVQEPETAHYFEAYESSSHFHIYFYSYTFQHHPHLGPASQDIFSDYNI
jgi:hypothetical protein